MKSNCHQRNADYLFSGWAASSYPANPGQFFLFVNGVPQGNSVNLPSATGVWQNYSALWNSGPSTNAVLEIRMSTTEAIGNDFVLDDLSFRRLTAGNVATLSIRKISAGANVELGWPSVTNQLYQLQWTSALETNQWFSLGSPLPWHREYPRGDEFDSKPNQSLLSAVDR